MSKEFSIKNKKVVIMGLGVHGGGVGVALWAAKHQANVLITDLKTPRQLKDSIKQLSKYKNIKYRLGRHLLDDFKKCDIVVANPIVRRDNNFLLVAKENKAKIYNDVSLFMKLCPCPVVGITGTKGKSTTAALTYHLFQTGKRRIYLGGNIRISPFSFLDKLKPNDLAIIEMSSWQCEGLASIKVSPHVALLTNLGIDHLNTYQTFAAYARAKSLIFKYQSKYDFAIFNKQDKYSQRIAKRVKSNKRYFNINAHSGNYFSKGYLYFKGRRLVAESKLPLIGDHNKSNILAALAICEIFNLSREQIKVNIVCFKILSGRMEKVRLVNNVTYINDTTATAPFAAIASIYALKKPIVLIAGGNDKKLDLANLADIIIERVNFVCLLPGTATDSLVKMFNTKLFVNYKIVSTMFEAVKEAQDKALSGDIVLLSPGATSFGSFINEFDRGDKFIKAVKRLK